MPKMNRREFPFSNCTIQAHVITLLSSSTPSYSFHGSNSSHSKDSGQGGRTYHVPNYATRATSYANEKSHLISVSFDEDKGAKKTIVVIVLMFLLLLGCSACAFVQGLQKSSFVFQSPAAVGQQDVEPPAQAAEDIYASTAESTRNSGFDNTWTSSSVDGRAVNTGKGAVDGASEASSLYWDELQGDAHCLAYGTRRYTARLRKVPFWANRTKACMETAVQINGLNIRSPDQCEVKARHPIAGY
ncbi:hypothetical protein NP233_g5454 [Leucocoprinus birnbaumii]|uniref:Uncharacterized protein n=1 Tax=Leucocoprinus birnbaumii TaxID=56174 RepID=A0AAD5VU35_9AGAR|nr:hypothetical protein NP233_g5454 [Leucocoprinus birnbaumii]